MKHLSIILLVIFSNHVLAQNASINPDLLKGQWSANWISAPGVPQKAYGVYHFRKNFDLPARPANFIIHVSADNRYRLFVNGKPVVSGPARGDLYNWFFESIDISQYLTEGNNTIAALVWNMGEHAPVAQVSNQTALVVQGNTTKESIINTDRSWKVYIDSAYTPCSMDNGSRLRTYMVIGPGDDVNGSRYPWNWEKQSYNDHNWSSVIMVTKPVVVGYGTDNMWSLKPRTIPLMEETMQRLASVRRTTGLQQQSDFLDGKHPLTIPANSKVSILIDQSYNTVAYPEIIMSKGRGSEVKVTYAEALFDQKLQKGNRDSIEGRTIAGNFDIFRPDGGDGRLFRPLWLRTFRYVQLDVVTKEEPLVIQDMYGMYTGYPFQENAKFSSNDRSLDRIWDVGWRTARLCAGETYYDCPYYEQLQYEGDTRIQSLISLYVSGDDRLMRKAITDFYHSRVPEGLTQGRYPSNRLQVIPPFSLYWVNMLYDYWMHRKDDAFIGQYLMAAQGVLDWYEKRVDSSRGMLGPMKWWNFVDWNTAFGNGVPDGADDGNSSIITLQFAYTLDQASKMFAYYKLDEESKRYDKLARTLAAGTYKHCFDKNKGVMANTPEKKKYSQHASIMGILAGSIPATDEQSVMKRVISDTTLSQATFYYRFYLTQAMKKAGMANLYYSNLKPWHDMLAIGLTTFAENPEPTRSDCHAWSSSPNYDFLATICGIMPSSPGFSTVSIKPTLGELNDVQGSMPHPQGTISVSLTRKSAGKVSASVELPPNVSGTFEWGGKKVQLRPGKQQLDL